MLVKNFYVQLCQQIWKNHAYLMKAKSRFDSTKMRFLIELEKKRRKMLFEWSPEATERETKLNPNDCGQEANSFDRIEIQLDFGS